MTYDQQKCLEISQSMSAIWGHANASLSEICASTALALRVEFDNENDKFMRAYILMNLIKHLTMDRIADREKITKLDILGPN